MLSVSLPRHPVTPLNGPQISNPNSFRTYIPATALWKNKNKKSRHRLGELTCILAAKYRRDIASGSVLEERTAACSGVNNRSNDRATCSPVQTGELDHALWVQRAQTWVSRDSRLAIATMDLCSLYLNTWRNPNGRSTTKEFTASRRGRQMRTAEDLEGYRQHGPSPRLLEESLDTGLRA